MEEVERYVTYRNQTETELSYEFSNTKDRNKVFNLDWSEYKEGASRM